MVDYAAITEKIWNDHLIASIILDYILIVTQTIVDWLTCLFSDHRLNVMCVAALKELLARHGKEAMDDAEAENDAHTDAASARRNPTPRAEAEW